MTKAGGSAFRKDVEFVAKDDEEQIATGIVMVPHAVDYQGDWERPETIRTFAEQFADFEAVGQASGGVMHAVFPDEHLELVENTILEEAQTIGGQEVPEGAWKQEWQVHDDQLWGLVGDVLEGYSIGADAVRWNGPMDQDDLPEEVTVPEEIDEDELVWELTDGIVQEVSAVDIPAVPDAQILETKSGTAKRLADHLGNRDGFVEEAIQRGHSEGEAERLWDYLNRAADVEGAGEPGEKSRFASIGRAVVDAVFGTDDGEADKTSLEAPDRGATVAETPDVDTQGDSAKEGRTLSTANRESLFATVDASLDVLQDAGADDLPKRFTDRDTTEFDLSEHDARDWAGDHDDENGDGEGDDEEGEESAASTDNPDPDGETSEGGSTDAADDMSENDTNDPDDAWDGAPEWAKDLRDTQEQNSKRLDEQSEQIEAALETEQEEKTAEVEIDGEIYEVTESQAKAWFDDDDPMADAPGWAKSLKSDIDAQRERLDRINRQSGTSQQLGAAPGGDGEGGEGDNLAQLGKLLS